MYRNRLHVLVQTGLLLTLPSLAVTDEAVSSADSGYNYADCINAQYHTRHSYMCCVAGLDPRGPMWFAVERKGDNCGTLGDLWLTKGCDKNTTVFRESDENMPLIDLCEKNNFGPPQLHN